MKWRKTCIYEIRTTELVKQYKNITAVDKLNLEIKQGELFSLLGVNGAGKTTTIKMLTCLTKATGGDAFVSGYSITKEPEQVWVVIYSIIKRKTEKLNNILREKQQSEERSKSLHE